MGGLSGSGKGGQFVSTQNCLRAAPARRRSSITLPSAPAPLPQLAVIFTLSTAITPLYDHQCDITDARHTYRKTKDLIAAMQVCQFFIIKQAT